MAQAAPTNSVPYRSKSENGNDACQNSFCAVSDNACQLSAIAVTPVLHSTEDNHFTKYNYFLVLALFFAGAVAASAALCALYAAFILAILLLLIVL